MIDPYHEIDLINRFFRDYKIGCETSDRLTSKAGKSYVVFGLKLHAGARITRVQACLRELAETLSAYRNQPTPVRLRHLPLALEVPHPYPEPLIPSADLHLEPHTMLLGKSYAFGGGEQEETVSLESAPHTLISGTTGSGKSKLLTNMLWSLCRYTSPAEVRLVLIDLKNEDLAPFAGLPHVEAFAASPDEAADAVWHVLSEKNRRVAEGKAKFQRWVMVADELAEFANVPGAIERIASIMGIGRSKALNVVAATQHPLAKIVGSVNKANFRLRLVGQVASGREGEVAGGRPALGAEFLPGKGSFLRVDGSDVRRFQSYLLDDPEEWLSPIPELWYQQLSFVLPMQV